MHKDSKYVLFLDDDARLHPGSIRALTSEMEKNPEVCISSCYTPLTSFFVLNRLFPVPYEHCRPLFYWHPDIHSNWISTGLAFWKLGELLYIRISYGTIPFSLVDFHVLGMSLDASRKLFKLCHLVPRVTTRLVYCHYFDTRHTCSMQCFEGVA